VLLLALAARVEEVLVLLLQMEPRELRILVVVVVGVKLLVVQEAQESLLLDTMSELEMVHGRVITIRYQQ
jgi:hypothetical protein